MTSPDSPPPSARAPVGAPEKLAAAALLALIGFGCFLRFWKLAADGLWYDELWTVVGASGRPFGELYREWMLGDPHPPGYFLFYFAWLKVFPNDEFWTRLPNVVVGVLTVLYLLLGTRKVLSRDERLFAAALASLSSLYLFYSVNVKQYSAVLFLVTVASIAYLEILRDRRLGRRRELALAAACVGLAYLNHFAMGYACVLLALLAALFRGVPAVLGPLRRIVIVLAVAYLPIAYFLRFALLYSGNSAQSGAGPMLSALVPSLFFDDPSWVMAFLVVLVLGLALATLPKWPVRLEWRSSRNGHLVLLLGTFTLCLVGLSALAPILVVRYFISAFPTLLLAVAILTAAAFPLRRPWLAALPLLFFARAAVVDFRTVDGMQRQQWDASVDLVLESARPQDLVYVLGANPDRTMLDYLRAGDIDRVIYLKNIRFYEYYFRRRGADEIANRLQVVEPNEESVAELVRAQRGSGKTVYVLAGHHIQFDDGARWTLEQGARSVETTWLYSTIVYEVAF